MFVSRDWNSLCKLHPNQFPSMGLSADEKWRRDRIQLTPLDWHDRNMPWVLDYFLTPAHLRLASQQRAERKLHGREVNGRYMNCKCLSGVQPVAWAIRMWVMYSGKLNRRQLCRVSAFMFHLLFFHSWITTFDFNRCICITGYYSAWVMPASNVLAYEFLLNHQRIVYSTTSTNSYLQK